MPTPPNAGEPQFVGWISRLQAFIKENGRPPQWKDKQNDCIEEKRLCWWMDRVHSSYKRGALDESRHQTLLEIPELQDRVRGWDRSKPFPTLQPPEEEQTDRGDDSRHALCDTLESLRALCEQLRDDVESVVRLGSLEITHEAVAAAVDSAKAVIDISGPILASIGSGESALPRPLDWACDRMLTALQRIRFRRQARRNVTRDRGKSKTSYPLGCSFGLTCDYRGGAVVSAATKRKCNQPLVKLICEFARKFAPEFKFTSVQVNKNSACCLHVDSGNVGPSLAISFGEHQGGELYVHRRGKLPVHKQFAAFDGNTPHLTCPFRGERFVCIFYTTHHWQKAKRQEKRALREFGFQLPSTRLERLEYPAKSIRLEEAMAELPADLVDCVPDCIKIIEVDEINQASASSHPIGVDGLLECKPNRPRWKKLEPRSSDARWTVSDELDLHIDVGEIGYEVETSRVSNRKRKANQFDTIQMNRRHVYTRKAAERKRAQSRHGVDSIERTLQIEGGVDDANVVSVVEVDDTRRKICDTAVRKSGGTQQALAKRGRGRPRKYGQGVELGRRARRKLCDPAVRKSDGTQQVLAKRGPGRPRKDGGVAVGRRARLICDPAVRNSDVTRQVLAKRGPGRPRKDGGVAVRRRAWRQLRDPAVRNSDGTQQALAKRGPGRPRKGGEGVALGRYARHQVLSGARSRTQGRLKASDLILNKNGKIVSRKASVAALKRNGSMLKAWGSAVSKAREALKIVGWCPVGGTSKMGKRLFARAIKIYEANV